jgi:hypothetical protein
MKTCCNLSMKYLVLLLTMMLLSSCFGNIQEPICSSKHELVQLLSENYPICAEQAKELPPSRNGVATLRGYGLANSVRVLQYTEDNQPILSISTNEGHSRTWIGLHGYFYTPNDETLNLSSEYTIIQVTEHVYCYIRS